MSVICPKCGCDDWYKVVKMDINVVLSNEDGEERFDESDRKQTQSWECADCGYTEGEQDETG